MHIRKDTTLESGRGLLVKGDRLLAFINMAQGHILHEIETWDIVAVKGKKSRCDENDSAEIRET